MREDFTQRHEGTKRAWPVGMEELATIAIDCGLKVHQRLGPGLLESVYEAILADRLERRGLRVARQRPISIQIDGVAIAEAFRADIVIENMLLIELKSVERIAPVHAKQVLTYIRLLEQPLGLLMNFGGDTFREGLKRVVDDFYFVPSCLRVSKSSPATHP